MAESVPGPRLDHGLLHASRPPSQAAQVDGAASTQRNSPVQDGPVPDSPSLAGWGVVLHGLFFGVENLV